MVSFQYVSFLQWVATLAKIKPFRSKMIILQSHCTAGKIIHVSIHNQREPGWRWGSRSVNWSILALLNSKDQWHFPLSQGKYCGSGRKRYLVLKSSFSKSASGVWKELLKEEESWKPSAAMKGSRLQPGWTSPQCLRQGNGHQDPQPGLGPVWRLLTSAT